MQKKKSYHSIFWKNYINWKNWNQMGIYLNKFNIHQRKEKGNVDISILGTLNNLKNLRKLRIDLQYLLLIILRYLLLKKKKEKLNQLYRESKKFRQLNGPNITYSVVQVFFF